MNAPAVAQARRSVGRALIWAAAAAMAPLAHAGFVATLDIDARSATGTSITLAPGTYQISWTGTAGGGLYDAWTYNTATSGNFRDAFSVTVNGTTTTYDRNDGNVSFNQYATAAAAISDFGNSAPATGYQVYTGASDAVALSVIQGPITLTTATTSTYVFSVPDYLLTDNSGGVSLRLQQLNSNVSTPGSLALVALGLGAAAGALRLRRRAAQTGASAR